MSCSSASVSLSLALLGVGMLPADAEAADIPADPSNYAQLIDTLVPGDVLQLAPGEYPRLTIDGVHGTADAWITIEGPAEGAAAVITSDACCNTVQIREASYVEVRNLTVDAQGLFVDPINAKDSSSHDILIENNTLLGFPADSQQIVGINTKVTVWNWTIRGNRIVEPGTGLYLGNSDGTSPFVNGVVEGNVVEHPTGYCMQVKHQNDYSPVEGMPAGPNRTLIRNNVFIKDDRVSPDGDRPNLLIGGFPDDGYGSDDRYEVYGNVLLGNPRESQLQATGSFSVHDNLLIGVGDNQRALVVTEHQGKAVRVAHVYNNTVYGGSGGIFFSAAAVEADAVVGNLVFSVDPIGGSITDARDNVVDVVGNAASYVVAPSLDPQTMDFYPRDGTAEGSPADLSVFSGDVARDLDFNGEDKGDASVRGAYAGAGSNPGCSIAELIDDPSSCVPEQGGTDTGSGTGTSGDTGGDRTTGDATGTDAGETTMSGDSGDASDGTGTATSPTTGAPEDSDAGDGCSCRGANVPVAASLWWLALLGLGCTRRRRPRLHIG